MNVTFYDRRLIILCLLALLTACSKQNDVVQQGPLDAQLTLLLQQASSGIGAPYFQLPESTDYGQIPQDPKNPITTDKVALGQLLFHETALAQQPLKTIGFGTYSCASCHHAQAGFQSCLPQGICEGGSGFGKSGEARAIDSQYESSQVDVQPDRSPSVLNVAYQTNMLWNGQFGATGVNIGTNYAWTTGTPKAKNALGYQGVETQAIAGQDVHRMNMKASAFQGNSIYKAMFLKAFNDAWTNDAQTAINAGLAIAAYERTLLPNRAPFQRWLQGSSGAMTDEQKQGAIIFFGKGNCVKCHTGPGLSSMNFYALGMANLHNGNYGSHVVVQADSSKVEHKGRGGFTGLAADLHKFKVPQLYNMKDSPFYGHGSSFTSIEQVVAYKNAAVPQDANVPTSQLAAEFVPLKLSTDEQKQLVTFLRDALYDAELSRYVPRSIPSGQAFPNNDAASRKAFLGL